jgi:O-antigen/teichoic acid export membrane protein
MSETIKNFFKKDGAYILIASLYTKAIAFITSILLIRILNQNEYGVIAYLLSTLAFFIPFAGGGLQHSFLRFAPSISSNTRVSALFRFTLYKGLKISFALIVVLYLLFPYFNLNAKIEPYYYYLLLLYLFTFFMIEMVKSNYRVLNNNKSFASIDAITSSTLLIIGCFAAYTVGSFAYLLAYVTVPFFVSLFFFKIKKNIHISIPNNYYSYGLWFGLGSIASQLMYSLDIFLVGQLVSDTTEVAIYKSASIIPLALLFIPNSFITTHYTDLAKHSNDKEYLVRFAKNYMKLFSVIALIIGLLLYYFATPLVLFIYGSSYASSIPLFQILVFGMVGAFVFRIPFGNLLAAVGKSRWNTFVAISILILNGVFSYYAILKMGIIGAAYVTSTLFWLSGCVSFILFYIYIKRLN